MYRKSFFLDELKARGVTKHPDSERSLKHSKTSELARLYFQAVEKEDKKLA